MNCDECARRAVEARRAGKLGYIACEACYSEATFIAEPPMHDADRIVRDLAACEPPFDYDEGDPGREYQCTLCEVGIATYDEDPKLHKPSCPWRRAKELNP